MKKSAFVAIASVTLLSACVVKAPVVEEPAPQPYVETPELGTQLIEPQVAAPVTTPEPAPVAEPAEIPAGTGTCDMSQALINIGQPVSSINTSGNTRVLTPTTPQTLDARADRLTIYVDESNNIITAQCI